MTIKLDVGASSYYSEIASIQTLDNLLRDGHIDILQYLERIPDGYIPNRRALIEEIKRNRTAMAAEQPTEPTPSGGAPTEGVQIPDIPGGRGYGELQRVINQTGDTRGLI
jgi:hypothetical protein